VELKRTVLEYPSVWGTYSIKYRYLCNVYIYVRNISPVATPFAWERRAWLSATRLLRAGQ